MVWIGAFIVGMFVGLLGSGGSILNIPILIYVAGEPEKAAIAESLVIVGIIAAFGAIPYARKKLIVWRSVFLFGIPGMLGAYLGASLSAFVPAAAQLTLLALIMLAAAYFMLQPPIHGGASHRAYWKIISDGLIVGGFTGLVGVGGGFLIVPTLSLLGGLTMHQAIGTSLTIIALNALASFAKHHDVLAALSIEIHWNIVWTFTFFGICGSVAGSVAARRVPQKRLRQAFAVMLLVLGAYMATRNLPALLRPDDGARRPGGGTSTPSASYTPKRGWVPRSP